MSEQEVYVFVCDSASIENGLIENIVIYFLPRSVVFSTLIIIDQPLYLGQLVTAS